MTPKAHILVVEDEEDIANLIKHALERTQEFTVTVAPRGDTALQLVAERVPDLIVLDLNLPVIDGLDVCRRVRTSARTAHVPIIMLTARTHEADRVAGLELGADDYVTKPFSMRELGARVRAVLRGRGPAAGPRAAAFEGLHLTADFDAMIVTVDSVEVRLTRRELELLQFLIAHRNKVVSRDRLLQYVWGYDLGVETRSVDVHIGRLRSKLGAAGPHIETVVGLGYRFVDEPASAPE